MDQELIKVYQVRSEGEKSTFDNVDTALTFIRAEVRLGSGIRKVTLETFDMTSQAFKEQVDQEDGA